MPSRSRRAASVSAVRCVDRTLNGDSQPLCGRAARGQSPQPRRAASTRLGNHTARALSSGVPHPDIWAAVLACVLQHLETPTTTSTPSGVRVPRAAVLVRISQHLEMPIASGPRAGVLVPRAAMLVRIPQRVKMPCTRSGRTGVLVPRAAIGSLWLAVWALRSKVRLSVIPPPPRLLASVCSRSALPP
jgi:hypothetical protein